MQSKKVGNVLSEFCIAQRTRAKGTSANGAVNAHDPSEWEVSGTCENMRNPNRRPLWK